MAARAFAGAERLTGKPRQATRTFVGTGGQGQSPLATCSGGRRMASSIGQRPRSASCSTNGLRRHRSSQRPRTVYENKRKIEARIRPTLGNVRLDKLEADTLDAVGSSVVDRRACRRPRSTSTTPSSSRGLPPGGEMGMDRTPRRRPGPRRRGWPATRWRSDTESARRLCSSRPTRVTRSWLRPSPGGAYRCSPGRARGPPAGPTSTSMAGISASPGR